MNNGQTNVLIRIEIQICVCVSVGHVFYVLVNKFDWNSEEVNIE